MASCPSCSQDKYVAERLDAWKTAVAALKGEKWHEDYIVDPADAMALARYLTGDQ